MTIRGYVSVSAEWYYLQCQFKVSYRGSSRSGISIGILVRSPFFWPYVLCAALSIMSKYVLRWRGAHLWNPSNFGVSIMFLLYPAAVASFN